MKKTRFIAFLTLSLLSIACRAALPDVAFFYAKNAPIEELHMFDIVVVEPKHFPAPKTFNRKNSQAYAYVSVGEAVTSDSYWEQIPKSWFIGDNQAWQAKIIDQTAPGRIDFFIQQVIDPLWKKGYRGFFFDTLDSYKIVIKSPEKQAEQARAIIQLIKAVKHHYPDSHLIINRGFEFIEAVAPYIDMQAVEDIYTRWDPKTKQFFSAKPEHIYRMRALLNKTKLLGVPVIVIDYVKPSEFNKAKKIAKQIVKDGFIPWITTPYLDSLGIGKIAVQPRKIYVIYDDSKDDLEKSKAFQYAAFPLEFFGYVPEFHYLSEPLPNDILKNRYQAIVLWLQSNSKRERSRLQPWLVKQKKLGIPILFLDQFGFTPDSKTLADFDIGYQAINNVKAPMKLVKQSQQLGFELAPHPPNSREFLSLKAKQGKVLLKITDANNQQSDTVAMMPWGGYVNSPNTLFFLPNDEARWIINPLEIFPAALHFNAKPTPDTTTLNGKRILFAHIDGDGFASRAEWLDNAYAGDVMQKEILEKYTIPTTVSIIEAELSPQGLYPKIAERLMARARSIFKLDTVEVASHSFSHPLDWQAIEAKPETVAGQYNLPVKGYQYDPKKEITDSVEFINQYLAPKNKPCTVFLWTGLTNPTAETLAITYQDGLLNMNGGDTVITNNNLSLTNIAPLGIKRGRYWQIFAPAQNENIYTNLWQGPFYGYRKVIDTFKLTNKPNRYKPIDIYYHFYSATKFAALKALSDVYDWSLKQEVTPIYASDYIRNVLDFYQLSLAQSIVNKNHWIIRTENHLREFRLPDAMGYPDLSLSKNVLGFKQEKGFRYLHLGPDQQTDLILQETLPSQPYLVETNGLVQNEERTDHRFKLNLISHADLSITLANTQNCQLFWNSKPINNTSLLTEKNKLVTIKIKQRQGELHLAC